MDFLPWPDSRERELLWSGDDPCTHHSYLTLPYDQVEYEPSPIFWWRSLRVVILDAMICTIDNTRWHDN